MYFGKKIKLNLMDNIYVMIYRKLFLWVLKIDNI